MAQFEFSQNAPIFAEKECGRTFRRRVSIGLQTFANNPAFCAIERMRLSSVGRVGRLNIDVGRSDRPQRCKDTIWYYSTDSSMSRMFARVGVYRLLFCFAVLVLYVTSNSFDYSRFAHCQGRLPDVPPLNLDLPLSVRHYRGFTLFMGNVCEIPYHAYARINALGFPSLPTMALRPFIPNIP